MQRADDLFWLFWAPRPLAATLLLLLLLLLLPTPTPLSSSPLPHHSLRHCPSGNDPRTAANELDCNAKKARWSSEKGRTGNLCHVDCSNRGTCDYRTGKCSCYNGYYGQACDQMDALAKE